MWLRGYIATVDSYHFQFIHVVEYCKYYCTNYKLALITRKLGQTPLIWESETHLLKYNSEYHAAALFGDVVC